MLRRTTPLPLSGLVIVTWSLSFKWLQGRGELVRGVVAFNSFSVFSKCLVSYHGDTVSDKVPAMFVNTRFFNRIT